MIIILQMLFPRRPNPVTPPPSTIYTTANFRLSGTVRNAPKIVRVDENGKEIVPEPVQETPAPTVTQSRVTQRANRKIKQQQLMALIMKPEVR